MIGKITWYDYGAEEEITATLEDNGYWKCPQDPLSEKILNYKYSVPENYSPGQGRPGAFQLHEAAKDFEAKPYITLSESSGNLKGVVF